MFCCDLIAFGLLFGTAWAVRAASRGPTLAAPPSFPAGSVFEVQEPDGSTTVWLLQPQGLPPVLLVRRERVR